MERDDDYGDGGYDEEKQDYIVSYAQLEQLGPRQRNGIDAIATAINAGSGMGAALRLAGQLRLDPLDRFKMLALIYYGKFGGDASYKVGWDKIIAKIPLAKWVRYKNPIGFVLGVRIINEKDEIDVNRLNATAQSFSETLQSESISKEDILRYARYWKTL